MACLLGEGTYGAVYKVNAKTARKIMESDEYGSLLCATMRELAALRFLSHPNLPTIHNIRMLWNGKVSFDMPLGICTLAKLFKRREPDAEIMRQIFDAVAYMHDQDIAHRDLHRDNIVMLSAQVPMIVDFGLARRGKPLPLYGCSPQMVTLRYRAPEVLAGSTDYHLEVDLWSLGCILYEWATRREYHGYEHEISDEDCAPSLSKYQLKFVVRFMKNKSKYLTAISDPMLRDLIDRLLVADSSARLSARDALRHPWLLRRSRRDVKKAPCPAAKRLCSLPENQEHAQRC